jgi:thioredoxin-related protein
MDRHRRAWFGRLPACLLVCLAAAPLLAAPPDGSGIQWQTDLKAAHKLAVRHQKPMLVVFGADWCFYCKKLEGETLGNRLMADYVRREFIPVHLDFDRDEKTAEILEVKSLPCTVVLSPKVDLLGRIEGYVKPAEYYSGLQKARALQARIAQTERSGGALQR